MCCPRHTVPRLEGVGSGVLSGGRRAVQAIADEAKGNVLIVTHGDAVNSSVSRLRPWAIVHPVHHTGFTAAYRDEKDGAERTQPVHACPALRLNMDRQQYAASLSTSRSFCTPCRRPQLDRALSQKGKQTLPWRLRTCHGCIRTGKVIR